MKFRKDILKIIDPEKETEKLSDFIRQQAFSMRREGAVVGLSGGVDSAVSAELCVRALGKDKVLGLILPEKESNPISKPFALEQVRKMGIKYETIDITPTLEVFGTYEKREAILKEIFPGYDPQSRIKITLPADLLSRDALNFFTLIIDDGSGHVKSVRLNKKALNGIVAATNTKHRTRMLHLYYQAEKLNYFVCGTTNRTEALQGFFVKYGDGGVDIEPLEHLYKMQVFQLAGYLGVIEKIIKRIPSPDTFSFVVSDEEFYFRMPYNILDLLLWAWENNVQVEEAAKVMDLTIEQVKRAFRDFLAKHTATRHLTRMPPSFFLDSRES